MLSHTRMLWALFLLSVVTVTSVSGVQSTDTGPETEKKGNEKRSPGSYPKEFLLLQGELVERVPFTFDTLFSTNRQRQAVKQNGLEHNHPNPAPPTSGDKNNEATMTNSEDIEHFKTLVGNADKVHEKPSPIKIDENFFRLPAENKNGKTQVEDANKDGHRREEHNVPGSAETTESTPMEKLDDRLVGSKGAERVGVELVLKGLEPQKGGLRGDVDGGRIVDGDTALRSLIGASGHGGVTPGEALEAEPDSLGGGSRVVGDAKSVDENNVEAMHVDDNKEQGREQQNGARGSESDEPVGAAKGNKMEDNEQYEIRNSGPENDDDDDNDEEIKFKRRRREALQKNNNNVGGDSKKTTTNEPAYDKINATKLNSRLTNDVAAIFIFKRKHAKNATDVKGVSSGDHAASEHTGHKGSKQLRHVPNVGPPGTMKELENKNGVPGGSTQKPIDSARWNKDPKIERVTQRTQPRTRVQQRPGITTGDSLTVSRKRHVGKHGLAILCFFTVGLILFVVIILALSSARNDPGAPGRNDSSTALYVNYPTY